MNTTITLNRLKETFEYSPETGIFKRKVAACHQGKTPWITGSLSKEGYLRICIDGHRYFAHRLAWLFVHGYLPENGLDHVDRDRVNNKIENLREVSQRCNNRNCGVSRNNTSGVKGVSWSRKLQKWGSYITVSRKQNNLGYYADFLEAVFHRLAAEQAENWAGCDSSSPAYQYVQKHIQKVI